MPGRQDQDLPGTPRDRRANDDRIDRIEREIADMRKSHQALRAEFETTSRALRLQLAENTRVTRSVRQDTETIVSIFTSLRGGFKVLGWLGTGFKWIVAIGTPVLGVIGFVKGWHK